MTGHDFQQSRRIRALLRRQGITPVFLTLSWQQIEIGLYVAWILACLLFATNVLK